ncbi:MAG: hypothetical protein JRJ58_10425 [Deltaproteobacteria bacterium]|nr:hypothetical protein [Deltaproteobacteria bacterium]
MTLQSPAHIGVCVTDIECSTRFDRDAPGFEEGDESETRSPGSAPLLGTDAAALRAVRLEGDGVRTQLLGFTDATQAAEAEPAPMPRPGFAHSPLRADDLDATIVAFEKVGGPR